MITPCSDAKQIEAASDLEQDTRSRDLQVDKKGHYDQICQYETRKDTMIRSVNARVLVTMKRCHIVIFIHTKETSLRWEIATANLLSYSVRKKVAILIPLYVCILRNQTIVIVFRPKQCEHYFRTSLLVFIAIFIIKVVNAITVVENKSWSKDDHEVKFIIPVLIKKTLVTMTSPWQHCRSMRIILWQNDVADTPTN